MSKIKPRGPSAASIIRDKQNRRFSWADAMSELIDNSVGNGATVIDVELSREQALVRDNGNGCSEKMFSALLSLGWNEDDEQADNPVSRYGVGAKDTMLWLGGPTIAASSRDGLYQMTTVDWESFGETFDYDDPISGEEALAVARELGVLKNGVVVFAPSHRRQMSENAFGAVHTKLGRLFWAAVETGVLINVTFTPYRKRPRKIPLGGPLSGKPMPKMMADASVDAVVSLEDGRSIRLVGGLLAPGERMSSPGFEYLYGHRVVIEAGGVGAGEYDFERLYVRVVLEGDKEDWNVTTNKAGLHDSDESALAQAVYDACKPLLEKASSEAVERAVDDAWLRDLANELTAAERKKAKRSPPSNNTGTKVPTDDGATHDNASKVHDERGRYKHRGGRPHQIFDIKITPFETENEHLCGKASIKDRVVRLNKLHPAVEAARKNRDKVTTRLLAWALWSDAWTRMEAGGQRKIRYDTDFVEKLSAMLTANMPPTK